mgnify:CR=1 FL=1
MQTISLCGKSYAPKGVSDGKEMEKIIDKAMVEMRKQGIKGKDTTPFLLAYIKELTGGNIEEAEKFLEEVNRQNKPVWIRQVVVPGIMDNDLYLHSLSNYLKKINNVETC